MNFYSKFESTPQSPWGNKNSDKKNKKIVALMARKLLDGNRIIPHIAVFAIENSVEFAVFPLDESHVDKKGLSADGYLTEVYYSGRIDVSSAYFQSVRAHMHNAMHKLYRYARDKFGPDRIIPMFESVQSMAISIPGVIHEGKEVLQLPLWNWESIRWKNKGNYLDSFDFSRQIMEILLEIAIEFDDEGFESFIRYNGQKLKERIEVYNDCAACAAAELSQRAQLGQQDAADFIFVKAHDGVNIGTLFEGHDRIPTHNSELGHMYPARHILDEQAGFNGICPFHGDCLEGYVCARSLYERAINAKKVGPFSDWKKMLLESKIVASNSGEFTKILLGTATNDRLKGHVDAVRLVGFYLAQLVHIIALFPSSPSQIVVGGRMATSEVLRATREFVLDFCNGYPDRAQLLSEKIDYFIVGSQFPNARQRELFGAAVIARKRAKNRISKSRLRILENTIR